jgi:hypothetical protein
LQDRRGRSVTGCLHQLRAVTCVTETDNAHVAQLDNAPDYGSGRWRFESFRARHCTILRDILRCRHRSPAWSPRRTAKPVHRLRRSHSPFTLSALVAQWTERRASTSGLCGFESCRGLQHFNPMRPRSSNGPERRRPKPQAARSNRAVDSILTNAQLSTNGELAERQGTAVLTRRDLRVGQVRLLHSPPMYIELTDLSDAIQR